MVVCFQTLSFSKIDNHVLFSKSHCRTLSFRITWRLLFSEIGWFYFSENCRFSFFWNLRKQSYCLQLYVNHLTFIARMLSSLLFPDVIRQEPKLLRMPIFIPTLYVRKTRKCHRSVWKAWLSFPNVTRRELKMRERPFFSLTLHVRKTRKCLKRSGWHIGDFLMW